MFGILRKIYLFTGSRRPVLTKAMAIAFAGAVCSAVQFAALLLALDTVTAGSMGSLLPIILLMVFSVSGKMLCLYHSTNLETEAGYFMVSEKRIHIGDRLRYIPMGYFNENSLGNITAVVTTTLGDVENTALPLPGDGYRRISQYPCALPGADYLRLAHGTFGNHRHSLLSAGN